MFLNSITCVLVIVIFGTANVTCNRIEECINQIHHVYGEHQTIYEYAKYAMQHFKDDMNILQQNGYARHYYYELKNHLTAGQVLDPRSFWVLSSENLKRTFGEEPNEVVQHAYLKEILIDNDNSINSKYMKHIIDHFGINADVVELDLSNFCLKEVAECLCRTQIDEAFSGCITQNNCMYYAMTKLRLSDPLVNDTPCAKAYFEQLRDRLDNERFLQSIDDPSTFFARVYAMSNDEDFRRRAIDVAIEITRLFRGKINHLTKVYNEEIYDEDDYSIYQLYVRHIYQKCREFDFQTLENFSPEVYCHIVRGNVRLNI